MATTSADARNDIITAKINDIALSIQVPRGSPAKPPAVKYGPSPRLKGRRQLSFKFPERYRTMLKTDCIAAFVAVAEAGSISEAARRLQISKSVVRKRLAELERDLGAALLHRTTRKLSITEDGRLFLERAVRIV